jgi:hypothetical protein
MAPMRTTLFAIIAAASLALVGCKKKPSTEELTKIKDEACACSDKACAEKIDKQMEKLLDGLDEKDLDDKTTSVAMEIAMCLAKQGVH